MAGSRSRSRSRSPDRGADAPAADTSAAPPAEDAGAPPPQADNGGGDDGEGVKLYIGNLDYSTDEPRLREVFGAFGAVTDVFLPMERGTSRPRGFGFVTLSTRQAAEDAIAKMDQSQLDGRTIRVNESRPRGEGPGARRSNEPGLGPGGYGGFNPSGRDEVKLYVGNLSFDTNEESVRGMFEQYGTVTDCFLPSDRDTGRPRGFAFVTMPAKEAETACAKVNGLELDGRTVRVNEAQPKGSGPGRGDRGGGGYGGGGYGGGGGYDDGRGGGGGWGGGGRGGYDDGYGGGGGGYGGGGGGYGGGRGGGYDDRGGGGGYSDRGGGGGGGGYNDGGGYGGGRGGGGGYSDRGGGGGGYSDRGGGGGYSGGGGGGYSGGGGGGYGGGY